MVKHTSHILIVVKFNIWHPNMLIDHNQVDFKGNYFFVRKLYIMTF